MIVIVFDDNVCPVDESALVALVIIPPTLVTAIAVVAVLKRPMFTVPN